MTSLVALYRGDTMSAAKIVAVSADPELVHDFAMRMLAELSEQESVTVPRDLERGTRCAARPVRNLGGEAEG